MPELPEVERVVRTLRPDLVGQAISAVEASGLALRQPVDLRALRRIVKHGPVRAVRRRGKYILIDLRGDDALLVHLGMSGQLTFARTDAEKRKHTHVIFHLANRDLRFVDPRRFGLVRPLFAGKPIPELLELGPDPFDAAFNVDYLQRAMRESRRDIKALLMDQTCIAGLGNIYVCEALFAAKISPRRRTARLSAERLQPAIVDILRRAIAAGGTSFSDYVDANGEKGENQLLLRVYAREGQPCFDCGAKVRRVVQGGRSSFYCPGCQQ